MAGNHTKKNNTERRDSLKPSPPQQRKNSNAKKDSAPSSSPRPTSASPRHEMKSMGGGVLPPFAAMAAAAGANQAPIKTDGFNGAEVITFLNLRYSDSLTSFHDTNLDSLHRPEMYEVPEPAPVQPAWGGRSGSPWAKNITTTPTPTATATSSFDFVSELMERAR
ncbi:hypothetical protein J3Q64DRAFT_1746682 [Phycomyces blakesleeanus]|uniref:Uncharacterized protein n=1 Tax=Phycomyces blakesleeanus TaxID=4837 RepID=A0ABR3AWD2_PHYBL